MSVSDDEFFDSGEAPSSAATPQDARIPPKRKRGRPPGSKNKPTQKAQLFQVQDADTVELLNQRNALPFMRTVWERISKQDDKLTQAMLNRLVQPVLDTKNPLAYLGDMKDVPISDLEAAIEDIEHE